MKTLRSKGKGFTILELLVVLAIVGIIAGLLLPMISSIQKKFNEAKEQATPSQQAEIKKEAEAGFPSEKILTISAEEYCKNHGKDVQDYEMVGVMDWRFNFQKVIPAGTEVVVGFVRSDNGYAGTALIPKQKVRAEAEEKDFRQE